MSDAYGNQVREDVAVRGRLGFGTGTVTLIMSPGDMKFTCDMDAETARDLGVALMDAANAIDQRLAHKRIG